MWLMWFILVWSVAIGGICIMKRMHPEDRIYPAWVVFIGILFTLYAVAYIS